MLLTRGGERMVWILTSSGETPHTQIRFKSGHLALVVFSPGPPTTAFCVGLGCQVLATSFPVPRNPDSWSLICGLGPFFFGKIGPMAD